MAPNGTGLTPPSIPLRPPPWERRARTACLLALRAFALFAFATLLAAPAASAAAPDRNLDAHPSLARILYGPLTINDSALTRKLSATFFWGGTYTASTGEPV